MTAACRAVAGAEYAVRVDLWRAVLESCDIATQRDDFDLFVDRKVAVFLGGPFEVAEGGALEGADRV